MLNSESLYLSTYRAFSAGRPQRSGALGGVTDLVSSCDGVLSRQRLVLQVHCSGPHDKQIAVEVDEVSIMASPKIRTSQNNRTGP